MSSSVLGPKHRGPFSQCPIQMTALAVQLINKRHYITIEIVRNNFIYTVSRTQMKTQAILYTMLFLPICTQTMDSDKAQTGLIKMYYEPTLPIYQCKDNPTIQAMFDFEYNELGPLQNLTSDQINAKTDLKKDPPLPMALLIHSFCSIEDRKLSPFEQPITPKNIFEGIGKGFPAGGIVGYFFDRPLTFAIIGAFMGGVGMYIYKKTNPDIMYSFDLEAIIKTNEALLKVEKDGFPIVDIHKEYQQNKNGEVHTLYSIATSTAKNLLTEPDKYDAWEKITKLVFDIHKKQFENRENAPDGWHKNGSEWLSTNLRPRVEDLWPT